MRPSQEGVDLPYQVPLDATGRPSKTIYTLASDFDRSPLLTLQSRGPDKDSYSYRSLNPPAEDRNIVSRQVHQVAPLPLPRPSPLSHPQRYRGKSTEFMYADACPEDYVAPLYTDEERADFERALERRFLGPLQEELPLSERKLPLPPPEPLRYRLKPFRKPETLSDLPQGVFEDQVRASPLPGLTPPLPR